MNIRINKVIKEINIPDCDTGKTGKLTESVQTDRYKFETQLLIIGGKYITTSGQISG